MQLIDEIVETMFYFQNKYLFLKYNYDTQFISSVIVLNYWYLTLNTVLEINLFNL